MVEKARSRVRPLLVRPGARFTCHGDGLCCADVHLLGPVSAHEREQLARRAPGSVVHGKYLTVLAPQANGHCVFLADEGGCRIYDTGLKPKSCHRFPFLLAATPEGGRIGTDHRCPCRTMGERAEVTSDAVAETLTNAGGRLWPDRRVRQRIALAHRKVVSFARYRAIESELLASLARGDVVSVVGDGTLPARTDDLWTNVAKEIDYDEEHPSRWSLMKRAFAQGLRAALGEPIGDFARPWAESFERAERRSPIARDPEEMLADWIADVIWSLEWTTTLTLAQARAELGLRAGIARRLAKYLREHGTMRADTAMAEAIAVVEVAGLAEAWALAATQLSAEAPR